eukprot:c17467_g1_i1.p1 GENE.c17467_g1_i1~~c17467_g1_i1.p1  ORF type:complete len:266 (-),score=59.28 c17467_g1_i1:26-823(-)
MGADFVADCDVMLFTPVNQIRLTNVAVVRYKKGGNRFEIACYKNKVMEWRSRVEKDIDNVLQTHTIFSNVSKGVQAKREDLVNAFKTEDEEKILLEILEKGQLQVADKERQQQHENVLREIVTIVSEKCVNPQTKRPYAYATIEKAVKDAHYSVVPSRTAKQQALEVIRVLQQANMQIERAKMRLNIQCPTSDGKRLKEKLSTQITSFENEDWSPPTYNFECEIDPGQFRQIESLVSENTRGTGRVAVLELQVQNDADTTWGDEE